MRKFEVFETYKFASPEAKQEFTNLNPSVNGAIANFVGDNEFKVINKSAGGHVNCIEIDGFKHSRPYNIAGEGVYAWFVDHEIKYFVKCSNNSSNLEEMLEMLFDQYHVEIRRLNTDHEFGVYCIKDLLDLVPSMIKHKERKARIKELQEEIRRLEESDD